MKLDKSVQITGLIILGVIILFVLFQNSFSSETNTVTGNGQATIQVDPNLVTVYFNAETKAETSQEATEANIEITEKLKTNILNLGFKENDIQTINFNVYPDYEWLYDKRQDNGYVATHMIRIEMSTEDTSKIGRVIDAGVGAGAGISYINFELSPEEEKQYKAQALELASEDARLKAGSIASGLGKKLGRLVSVSESNAYYTPMRVYETAGDQGDWVGEAKEAVNNIQPSEQEITANVYAVFKLR